MTKHTPTSPYEIWRRPQVEKVTGLSRNSIHRRIDDNLFPKPISLGGRSIGWRSIDLWPGLISNQLLPATMWSANSHERYETPKHEHCSA